MCLLAVIAEEPSYGYEMARKLEGRGLALVGEGSIYPLLSRLQRNGLVEPFNQASSDEANVPDTAADIIRQYTQRRPQG